MSDLIERQAAIDAILKETAYESVRDLYEYAEDYGNAWCIGVVTAIDAIIAVPSAEPEIIKGKECKYADCAYALDSVWCKKMDVNGFKPDYYCGFAERKSDG